MGGGTGNTWQLNPLKGERYPVGQPYGVKVTSFFPINVCLHPHPLFPSTFQSKKTGGTQAIYSISSANNRQDLCCPGPGLGGL